MSARKPRPASLRHRAARRATLTAVLAATALSTGLTAPSALAATPDRTGLPSAVPGWINAGGRFQVKDMGAAPGTQTMTLRVYLSGNDAGLVQAAREVSTPGSRSYAHYLTPSQFSQRFGAGKEQVDTVRSWLTGFGMSVTDATPHYLAVTATVDEAQRAFDTSLHSFARAQGFPMKGFAPVSGISVPAALGKDIVTVIGLDAPPGTHPAIPTPDPTPTPTPGPTPGQAPDSVPAQGTTGGPRHQATPGAPGTSAAAPTGQAGQASAAMPPCSTYWGEKSSPIPAVNGRTSAPDAVCGYTPQQMRDAYGVTNSKYTGKGRTVAVVLDGALPTMEADADRFFAAHGVAGFAPGQYSENHGPGFQNSCNGSSELPEEPLDVESVHLTAPDAKVVYVAADCQDNTPDSLQLNFLDAETRIVDQHLADVSTDSYSTQEGDYDPAMIAAWDLTFQQGALEGISFDFDSGDAGDGASGQFAGLQPASVLFPASDPWATAAGGTTLELGKGDKVVGEYGWGFDRTQIDPQGTGYLTPPPGVFQEGSTGGRSAAMDQPWYQQGVVPSALATANGTGPAHREVPDISADADGATGWLIGYTDPSTQTYSEMIGGGTSGSSPLIAGLEADAAQAAGHALGFANPLLYSLRGKPAIHDVLPAPADQPPLALEHQPSGTQPGTFDTFLATLDQDSSLHTTPGYDDATGLGSLTPDFVKSLAKKR